MSPAPAAEGRRVPLATVTLNILGRQTAVAVPVPSGPSRLLDLYPAAAALASGAADVTVEHAREQGKEISCRAGCGACCRQLVIISVVEAQRLAELIATMPEERRETLRRRFADAVHRLEQAGLLDPAEAPGRRGLVVEARGSDEANVAGVAPRYFAQGISCPFLEDESCSIPPDRPTVCRGYHVTSPAENCSRLYETDIEKIEPPFHMGDVLGDLAEQQCGTKTGLIPLVLSLEWSAANGAQLDMLRDGRELFRDLMVAMGARAGG